MGNNISPETFIKFYTIDEACMRLRCGRTTIYKHLDSGRLEAIKVGGKTLILHDDLIYFIKCSPKYK